jgi:hypothetical protein
MGGDLTKAAPIAPQSASSTPQPPPGELEHPSQRTKLPSYDDLKQDSHIRNTPPRPAPPATARRGKKRARSPSPARSMSQTSPAPVVAEKTPPALSATQTPVLAQQHPKKKSKTNKIKVSLVFPRNPPICAIFFLRVRCGGFLSGTRG